MHSLDNLQGLKSYEIWLLLLFHKFFSQEFHFQSFGLFFEYLSQNLTKKISLISKNT
jgi:hypothetical protein